MFARYSFFCLQIFSSIWMAKPFQSSVIHFSSSVLFKKMGRFQASKNVDLYHRDNFCPRANLDGFHNKETSIQTLKESDSFEKIVSVIRQAPSGTSLSSDKVGIGISFGITADGDAYVTALISNGSAERSGLIKVGDRLCKVDNKDVRGCSVQDIVKMIVGPPSTPVQLTVLSRYAGPQTESETETLTPSQPSKQADDEVDAVERKYKALAKQMVKNAIKLPTGGAKTKLIQLSKNANAVRGWQRPPSRRRGHWASREL